MCEERYGSGSVSHRYTANKEQQFEKRLLQHSTYFAIRKFFLVRNAGLACNIVANLMVFYSSQLFFLMAIQTA